MYIRVSLVLLALALIIVPAHAEPLWLQFEDLRPGQRVLHEREGEITILSVDPNKPGYTYRLSDGGRTAVAVILPGMQWPRVATSGSPEARELSRIRLTTFEGKFFHNPGELAVNAALDSLFRRIENRGPGYHAQATYIKATFRNEAVLREALGIDPTAPWESVVQALCQVFEFKDKQFVLRWYALTGENLVRTAVLEFKGDWNFFSGGRILRANGWGNGMKVLRPLSEDVSQGLLEGLWNQGLELIAADARQSIAAQDLYSMFEYHPRSGGSVQDEASQLLLRWKSRATEEPRAVKRELQDRISVVLPPHFAADAVISTPTSTGTPGLPDLYAKTLAPLIGAKVIAGAIAWTESKTTAQHEAGGLLRRIHNVGGRIDVRKNVLGKSILLVDDVYTTGATLEAARAALMTAGASRVTFAVIAKTKPRTACPEALTPILELSK